MNKERSNKLQLMVEKHSREVEILFLRKKILETVYLNRDDYTKDLNQLGDLMLDVELITQELKGVSA